MNKKSSKLESLSARHHPDIISAVATADINMGGLDSYIGYNLRRAHIGEFQRFFSFFDEHDIRPQQFSVLVVIRENPGINQSQVGSALGIKRANVVTILHELEARGLVERCPASHDKRSYTLRLTDKGLDSITMLQKVHDELEAEVTECIGQENREIFLALLKLLRSKNKDMDRA